MVRNFNKDNGIIFKKIKNKKSCNEFVKWLETLIKIYTSCKNISSMLMFR